MQNTNTIMAVVPGGCTKLVQPADVSWNAPFKAAYRKLYDTWLASGTMERTRSGHLRAPSKALRVQWVPEAWDSIRPEIIYKSFEACGITSDPSLKHCAKQTGVANPLYHQLQQWHQSNDTAPGDETFDTNDSGEATVLASDREDVVSDEFQEENFTDSNEVDAD